MDSFRFAHPEYFYIFLVIPALVALFLFNRIMRARKLRNFGQPELLAQLTPSLSTGRPVVKFILWMLAISCLITALAQPQFGSKLTLTKRKGVELIIALDVSNSMRAQDIKPNRLERAKRAIAKLTDRLKNDKIGLVVFAGQAYVQLPITSDYTSAKLFLETITTDVVPVQGTAIGAAIGTAIKSFSPTFQGSRAIIVITDGENHEDDAVGMAKKAKDKGIVVHTIGMGLPQGAPIPLTENSSDFLKDKTGSIVVTKLDEPMLTSIAEAGGGSYIRANNAEVGLNNLFNEIEKMQKTEMEAREYSEYNDQFPLFLTLAFLFILADLAVLDRKNKWLKNFRLFGIQKRAL
ncbi:MAG: VWA domain-containing protein [Marinilabiliales bacterium]|nr:VWA domain-containing protein [Marinilabiliales bacterium]